MHLRLAGTRPLTRTSVWTEVLCLLSIICLTIARPRGVVRSTWGPLQQRLRLLIRISANIRQCAEVARGREADLQRNQYPEATDRPVRDRRWAARIDMHVPIVLSCTGSAAVHATILNMSDEGFMLKLNSATEITRHAIYSVKIGGYLNAQCYAVWQANGCAGMQLTMPIHPAVVSSLAREFPRPIGLA